LELIQSPLSSSSVVAIGAKAIAPSFQIADFFGDGIQTPHGGDFGISCGYARFFVLGEFLFALGATVLV
jgi:hypothetical protein